MTFEKKFDEQCVSVSFRFKEKKKKRKKEIVIDVLLETNMIRNHPIHLEFSRIFIELEASENDGKKRMRGKTKCREKWGKILEKWK